MDEAQKRRKYRAIKVIITEFFMVLTVVALVFLLTFIVMGYKITNDGELEQDGFLQVRTSPSGAVVTIDDDQLLSRTNMSKAISAGEHEISFSKDGYGTWKKKILITSGLTYRLNYPILFLKDRQKEKVANFEGLDFTSVSPDYNLMIVSMPDTREWKLVQLDEDKPTTKSIKLAEILPEISEEGFSRLRIVEWNEDSDKVLAIAEWDSKREWVVIDVKKPENSKNLTVEFGMNFSNVKMKNKSGEQLLVLENGNLRNLNISTAEVSRILLDKVESFNNYGSDIIYVGRNESGDRQFGFYQEGNDKSEKIMSIETSDEAKAVMGEYYGDIYAAFVTGNDVKIYRGNLNGKPEDKVILVDDTLDFIPSEVSVRGGGELIMLRSGKSYAIYDVETNRFSKYELENEQIEWINDYMFSFVDEDGTLVIKDFDGGNRRKLSNGVKGGFDVTITSEKWMYYIDAKNNLVRETIVD